MVALQVLNENDQRREEQDDDLKDCGDTESTTTLEPGSDVDSIRLLVPEPQVLQHDNGEWLGEWQRKKAEILKGYPRRA